MESLITTLDASKICVHFWIDCKSFVYMVLILDGNSEYVKHVFRKICLFKKILSVTSLDLIKCLKQFMTEIAPDVHTYFRVTIVYKYHVCLRVKFVARIQQAQEMLSVFIQQLYYENWTRLIEHSL